MASPVEPSGSTEYSKITIKGNSRSHLGNNYTTNVYNNSTRGSDQKETQAGNLSKTLYYPEIDHRENQIYSAAEYEYKWAFQSWPTSLVSWLTSKAGLFWVCGKAGSGKSTFMKFLRHHSQCKKFLRVWAEDKKVVVATHYFWYAATQSVLQHSREGLYRNLLFQVIQSGSVPPLLPDRWKREGGLRGEVDSNELLRGLESLAQVLNAKFVFFIDGLDECYPASEHSILVANLERLSRYHNIKLCVSSRPWKPFEPRFRGLTSRLNLQDLTAPDINRFVLTEMVIAEQDAGMELGICNPDRSKVDWRARQEYHHPAQKSNEHTNDSELVTRRSDSNASDNWSTETTWKLRLRSGNVSDKLKTVNSQQLFRPAEQIGDENAPDSSGLNIPSTMSKLGELELEKPAVDIRVEADDDMRDQYVSNDARHLTWLITNRAEGVFLWAFLLMRILRDEIFAGRRIEELEGFVNEVPSDLIDFYKYSIWKRIGWRRERQVAKALKIAAVLAAAEEPLRYDRGSLLSLLHFWHLQEPNELEDPQFSILAPIQELSDNDVERMSIKTRAFLGEVCKDLIQVERKRSWMDEILRSGIPDYGIGKVEFLHRSVLEYLTDMETQSWINNHVPDHFKTSSFFVELLLARLKLFPGSIKATHRLEEVFKILRTRKYESDQSIFHKLRVLMGDSTRPIICEFERVITFFAQACHVDGFFYSLFINRGILLHAGLFADFGLVSFIRATAFRYYCIFFDGIGRSLLYNLIGCLHDDHDFDQVCTKIESVLRMGVSCGLKEWDLFLYTWWNLDMKPNRKAGLRSDHDVNAHSPRQTSSTSAAIPQRMFSIATELLTLSPELDLDTEVCLSHVSELNCSFTSSSQCLKLSSCDALKEMIPGSLDSALLSLRSHLEDPAWLQDRVEHRSELRASYLREARDALLQSSKQGPSFDWRYFEVEFAKWVLDQEAYAEDRDPSTEEHGVLDAMKAYVDMLGNAICQKCGTDVLNDGFPRWICLSCLRQYYCTLCLPAATAIHSGPFQCLEPTIGAAQLDVPGPPSSEKIVALVHAAMRFQKEVYQAAMLNHESTKDLSLSEAEQVIVSIVEQHMYEERDFSYLQTSEPSCLRTATSDFGMESKAFDMKAWFSSESWIRAGDQVTHPQSFANRHASHGVTEEYEVVKATADDETGALMRSMVEERIQGWKLEEDEVLKNLSLY